jgi:uncharacterized protein
MKKLTLLLFLLSHLAFSQENKFRSEEVDYWNMADSVHIYGTLTMPETGSKFPAVLLITGSGPEDRDETILGHKPFKVIAEYLSNRGFAVLRVDDRGVGKTTLGKNPKLATSENFAKDVLSGVDFLKNRSEINASKIGLIGHSEGGMIAPMAANQSKDVAFIVSLAGTGVAGDVIMQKQLTQQVTSLPNLTNDFKQKYENYIANILKAYKIDTSRSQAIAHLDTLTNQWKASLNPEDVKIGRSFSIMYPTLKSMSIDWGRFFIRHDPKIELSKIKIPILALNGSKDTQVYAYENLKGFEEGLQMAENTHYKIVKLEGLNHLFQHAKTGFGFEYATIKEDFAPEALQIMGDWLTEITK